jgi:hypothetical protein
VLGTVLALVGGLFLLVVATNPGDFKDAQGNRTPGTAAATFLILFIAPGASLIYFGQRARKRRARASQKLSLAMAAIPITRAAELPGSVKSGAACTAPAQDLLDSARRYLEQGLGRGVQAVGLFHRVEGAGCLTYLLGGILGIAIGVPLGIVGALAGPFGVLVAMVIGLGLGQMWAAHMLRKAKEIPEFFAVAITADRVHFHKFSLEDKANTLKLGPESTSWPRAALSVVADDIEMRPAGVPALATTPTTYPGLGFLLNGKPMLQAQVLSVVPSEDGVGVAFIYSTKSNAAFDLLQREQPALAPSR